MKRLILTLAGVLSISLAAPSGTGGPKGGKVIQLWPAGTLPAAGKKKETATATARPGEKKVTRITNVTNPTITVFSPAKATDTTAAVVICPGGGYGILAWDKEGTEVAEWLNSIGVTAVLLKYRVPKQRDEAFQDAQRALGIVRSRAKEWNIDPRRIGILGFSAGGHLAARLSTNHAKRTYKTVDDCDEASCRPDFAILIYPAYLAGRNNTALDRATLPVTGRTPKTFIAIAFNDKFTLGALHYFTALRKAKVHSELHVFQTGGHGCGLRKSDAAVTTWPQHCRRWLREIKVIAQ